MRLFVKKITWNYNTNIKGEKINKRYLFAIRYKKSILDIFKKPRYLIILDSSDNKKIVKFTTNINRATKYDTQEIAIKAIEKILSNPNEYIIH